LCLEQIHLLARQGERISEQTTGDIFTTVWRSGRIADKEKEEKMRARALDSLKQYVQLYADRFQRVHWVEENLEYAHGIDFTVDGRLDLLCRDGSAYELIDFKVRTREGLEILHPEYQLETYGLALSSAADMRISHLHLHLLLEKPRNEVVTLEWNDARQRKAEERVSSAFEGIRSGLFDPTPGHHCRYCDFRNICPVSGSPTPIGESPEEGTTVGVTL
jgi:CRISPR/Cas system-associated exonuclease Cas4 (RecB family)